jgi:hypothetical protein
MDAMLLGKLFGNGQRWQGACTVILDTDASIQSVGPDNIGSSATKSYAPRLVSGRIAADTVCLINEGKTLLIIQQQRIRQGPNEELTKHTLTVVDCAHVVAVEFPDTTPLAGLGITAPAIRTGSHSGTMQRPVYS